MVPESAAKIGCSNGRAYATGRTSLISGPRFCPRSDGRYRDMLVAVEATTAYPHAVITTGSEK